MIRINLLGRRRPQVKRRIAIAGTLQLALFLIPLVLAVGALVWRYYSITDDIAGTQRQIDELNRQKLQLARLEAEIRQFEEKQNMLQTRLAVIEELRRNQKGPVQLLDAIGGTVHKTETLWLTKMDERGTKVTLEGVAGSVNAVANLITNLQDSGFFQNIEIKEVIQSTDTPGVENYNFSLSCDFVLPQPAPTAPPPATTPPAAPAGRRT